MKLRNRLTYVLRQHLNGGDVSAMLKRTLIVIAVGIWIAFAACVLLVWSLTARAQSPDNLSIQSCATPAANWATLTACRTQTAQAGGLPPTPTRMPLPTPRATPTRIESQRMYCRAGSVTVIPVAPGRELVMCEEWTP